MPRANQGRVRLFLFIEATGQSTLIDVCHVRRSLKKIVASSSHRSIAGKSARNLRRNTEMPPRGMGQNIGIFLHYDPYSIVISTYPALPEPSSPGHQA